MNGIRCTWPRYSLGIEIGSLKFQNRTSPVLNRKPLRFVTGILSLRTGSGSAWKQEKPLPIWNSSTLILKRNHFLLGTGLVLFWNGSTTSKYRNFLFMVPFSLDNFVQRKVLEPWAALFCVLHQKWHHYTAYIIGCHCAVLCIVSE